MDCVKHIFISFNSNICEVVAVMTLNVNCTKLYFNLKTPFPSLSVVMDDEDGRCLLDVIW